MLNAILIEDDLFYRTKIIYLLEQIGVNILGIAENNSSAIKLLTEFKPNIIIAEYIIILGYWRFSNTMPKHVF